MSNIDRLAKILFASALLDAVSDSIDDSTDGYNGTIIVTKTNPDIKGVPYTVGKSYQFENGKVKDDIGVTEPVVSRCHNIDEVKTYFNGLVEFKELDQKLGKAEQIKPEKAEEPSEKPESLNCRFVVTRSDEEDLPVGMLVEVKDGKFEDLSGESFPDGMHLMDEKDLHYYFDSRLSHTGCTNPRLRGWGYTTNGIGYTIVREVNND